jgi:hypothetical protein
MSGYVSSAPRWYQSWSFQHIALSTRYIPNLLMYCTRARLGGQWAFLVTSIIMGMERGWWWLPSEEEGGYEIIMWCLEWMDQILMAIWGYIMIYRMSPSSHNIQSIKHNENVYNVLYYRLYWYVPFFADHHLHSCYIVCGVWYRRLSWTQYLCIVDGCISTHLKENKWCWIKLMLTTGAEVWTVEFSLPWIILCTHMFVKARKPCISYNLNIAICMLPQHCISDAVFTLSHYKY